MQWKGPLVSAILVFASVAGHGAAEGGSVVVQLVAPGDLYVTNTGLPCLGACPGYEGLTHAFIDTSGHVGHPFRCEVLRSLAGAATNVLPFPANMAGADSIRIAFDADNDGRLDAFYGGRMGRPSSGEATQRVLSAGLNPVALLDAIQWYVGAWQMRGPSPTVEGTVQAPQMQVLNEGGLDVEVECTF